jgi:DNA-binding protein HU-beta
LRRAASSGPDGAFYRERMNKTQLVDALADRLGDRRTAAAAVEGLLETIVDRVRSGETVTLTGFGVFESRARAARTARNPRTGVAVDVPATTVPAFRPGTAFRAAVGTATPAVESASASTEASTAAAAEPVATADAVATAKPAKNGKAKSKDRDKSGDKADKGKAGKGKKAKAKK